MGGAWRAPGPPPLSSAKKKKRGKRERKEKKKKRGKRKRDIKKLRCYNLFFCAYIGTYALSHINVINCHMPHAHFNTYTCRFSVIYRFTLNDPFLYRPIPIIQKKKKKKNTFIGNRSRDFQYDVGKKYSAANFFTVKQYQYPVGHFQKIVGS